MTTSFLFPSFPVESRLCFATRLELETVLVCHQPNRYLHHSMQNKTDCRCPSSYPELTAPQLMVGLHIYIPILCIAILSGRGTGLLCAITIAVSLYVHMPSCIWETVFHEVIYYLWVFQSLHPSSAKILSLRKISMPDFWLRTL